MRQKKHKDYINPIHRHSTDTSSQWTHDKYESYSSYEYKGGYTNHSNGNTNHNGKYRQRKSVNELSLTINSKTLILNNYENMEKKAFIARINDHLAKLKLDQETYLLTKIKIFNELSANKSKHFDNKEYEQLLSKFMDISDK